MNQTKRRKAFSYLLVDLIRGLFYFSFIFIAIMTLKTSNIFAQDIEVEAQGKVAVVDRDINRAQAEAKKLALRNAVEQGAGVIIDSNTIIQNYQIIQDRVFSNSRGFIKNYKVLMDTTTTGDSYYIYWIKATVSREKLESALTSIEVLRLQQMERGNKSIIVIYDPRASDATLPLKFNDSNEREVILSAIQNLNKIFLEKQFNVFDENRLLEVNEEMTYSDLSNFDEKALYLAKKNSADLLITFRLISTVEKDKNFSWAITILSGKAVFAGNGQLIGTNRQKSKQAFKLDASGFEVFDNMSISATKAAEIVAKELTKQILVTAPPKEMYRLTFNNLESAQKRAVKRRIRNIKGYKSHRIVSETVNGVNLELDLELGDNADFSTLIQDSIEKDSSFKGYFLESECQRNRCNFAPVLK